MTKSIYFLILWMAFSVSGQLAAQGITISTGANITVSGSATIQIQDGNFVNNGTYTKGSETITLSGTVAGEISGSTNTSIHNLSVTNSGGITTKMSQLTANAMSIAAGSKFTIDTVKAVIVTTNVTNSAGTPGLLIKAAADRANGTLIFHNAVESPVQATVEMYSKAAKADNYKWQYFGIPVRSVSADPAFSGSYIRSYHETAAKVSSQSTQWKALNNDSVLKSFKAYEITQLNPKTISIAGELENRDTTIQLTYTTTGNYPGQNLIGNPYASAIDITQLTFGEATEQTVYLYNTGSYAQWSAASGYGENPGQYVAIPKNLATPPTELPREIPSMQAFLVQKLQPDADSLTSFTFQINYNDVATKNTTQQRINASTTEPEDYPFVKIKVGGSRFYDQAWLFEVPGCSPAFDNGWDGYEMEGAANVPQIYVVEETGNFQVNSTASVDGTILGFRPGEGADYHLIINVHRTFSDNSDKIYLSDLETGQTVELRDSDSVYDFSATPFGLASSRFLIRQGQGADYIHKTNPNDLQISLNNGELFVDNNSQLMANMTIYTVSGKSVYTTSVKPFGKRLIKTSLQPGMYIINAVTPELKADAKMVIN